MKLNKSCIDRRNQLLKEKLMDELNTQIISEFSDKGIVIGNGSLNSRVLLIGEAPGAKEVEQKKPFVGQAGKHLQEFLDILQLDRNDLYITNTVKFRPTKESKKTGGKINRAPTKSEINQFKGYLFKEINIVSPQIIVTLGNVPLKTILQDEQATIGDYHGKKLKTTILDTDYILFPLYHPAAVIYRRELREVYLNDLRQLALLLET